MGVEDIVRVRELHQGEWLCFNPQHPNPDIGCPDRIFVCAICHQDMPCDTARLIYTKEELDGVR